MTIIEKLVQQYFDDLKRDGREDTPENMRAWLWFTCPAQLRDEVAVGIEMQRKSMREK